MLFQLRLKAYNVEKKGPLRLSATGLTTDINDIAKADSSAGKMNKMIDLTNEAVPTPELTITSPTTVSYGQKAD